ncbi:cyclic nucleotide-binding domain-containing protein [Leptobacterium flavescens]|uniref:Cyclic nucleotide-binding domain-containing protein n=1 Tax=Leptobacterium flavescens TaxID=472055 RepID=A0A6P0UPK6_9FLAO|nr:Crp/Fnr family transcriptional regulator [Leptobacterium flavescens]NER12853.1 cyclic nucleotide-binding domain-containing protein [Leptobacterium flavescens]
MKNVDSGIQQIHPISDEALKMLKIHFEQVEFSKGQDLFSPHRKHHYINFLEEGLVRAYSYHEEKEITFWFGLEGDVVFPYRTYLQDEISYETVECLEDCLIYRLPHKVLKELFLENIEWATWGRKFAEKQMVFLEERFIDYQFQSGAGRYEKLLQERPELFNRIKLQHLASYLRMSQVSLSRIRAGIQ